MMVAGDSEQRVLVALNTTANHQISLSIASCIARCMDLLLEGVFIEDENLLDMSELPFLREISPTTFLQQPIDPLRMRQSLAARSRMLEDSVQAQAAKSGVRYLYRTWRGRASLRSLTTDLNARILCIAGSVTHRQRALKENDNPATTLYVVRENTGNPEKLISIVDEISTLLPCKVKLISGQAAGHDSPGSREEVYQQTSGRLPSTFASFYDMGELFNRISDSVNPVFFIEATNPLIDEPEFARHIKSSGATVFVVR